jgi:hypothetical protein
VVLRSMDNFQCSGQRLSKGRGLWLATDILETASPDELQKAIEILRSESVPENNKGIAIPQLQQRIKVLTEKEPLLQHYRAVQTLHFTDLKAQIVEKIPDKLENASLKDLTSAFKVFHDAERDIEDPSRHIKGIVAYLLHIDEAELKGQDPLNYGEVIDVQSEPVKNANLTEDGIRIPRL